MKGWIYIATMTNTIGVVKIGYTYREPDTRVREWSRHTGAPGTGEVKYAALVENPQRVEKAIHRSLAECRQSNSEWFKCKVSDVVTILKQHADVHKEDDRAAAAIEAERKKREIESERRRQREIKERQEKEASDAQARNVLLQKRDAEKRYLTALAKWEERRYTEHFSVLLGSAIFSFLLSFFLTLIVSGGERDNDNLLIVFVLFVPIFILTRWFLHIKFGKPKLRDFAPNTREGVIDYSVREAKLASEPELQDKTKPKDFSPNTKEKVAEVSRIRIRDIKRKRLSDRNRLCECGSGSGRRYKHCCGSLK
jgi:hypothetical protein